MARILHLNYGRKPLERNERFCLPPLRSLCHSVCSPLEWEVQVSFASQEKWDLFQTVVLRCWQHSQVLSPGYKTLYLFQASCLVCQVKSFLTFFLAFSVAPALISSLLVSPPHPRPPPFPPFLLPPNLRQCNLSIIIFNTDLAKQGYNSKEPSLFLKKNVFF